MEEQANTNMNTPKKVYFETLGCKTNQYESENKINRRDCRG